MFPVLSASCGWFFSVCPPLFLCWASGFVKRQPKQEYTNSRLVADKTKSEVGGNSAMAIKVIIPMVYELQINRKCCIMWKLTTQPLLRWTASNKERRANCAIPINVQFFSQLALWTEKGFQHCTRRFSDRWFRSWYFLAFPRVPPVITLRRRKRPRHNAPLHQSFLFTRLFRVLFGFLQVFVVHGFLTSASLNNDGPLRIIAFP